MKRKIGKRILELDEERRLLNWTRQNRSFRDYIILLTILRTGLDTAELCELLISDISADGEIRTQLEVREEIASDQKPRTIPLPNDLREQLKAFLDWKWRNSESVDAMSFLFASAKSLRMTLRHLQRIVRESTIGALGAPYLAHDLRRTFEARLLAQSSDQPIPKTTSIDSPKETIRIEGRLLMLDDAAPHAAIVVQAVVPSADAEGEPVVVATVLSNKAGKYQLINLKPGRYQVRCYTLDGYIYYQKGEVLQVKRGDSLSNIDFHFASFKKGGWKNYNPLDGLAHYAVNVIHQALDGTIWFGTDGGVSRYDGKEFVTFTTKDGLAHNRVHAIHQTPDGVIWFGTDTGVSRYDGQRFVTFDRSAGFAKGAVMAIHQAPDGVIWFGTWGGGVCRYDGKAFITFTTKDGLAHNITAHAWGIVDTGHPV